MVVQPSTLTTQEIVDIQNHYGLTSGTTSAIVADLINGTFPPEFSADDLMAYLAISGVDWSQVFSDTALADPDASAVAYLFEDTATQTMAQELIRDNPDDVSVSDWKAYLEACNIPTDVLNQAVQILSEASANGELATTDEIETETLYELCAQISPAHAAVAMAFNLQSDVAEMMDVATEKMEEWGEAMQDLYDRYDDVDMEDGTAAQVELAKLSLDSSALQAGFEAQKSFNKTMMDTYMNIIEMGSALAEKENTTGLDIIRRF